jgi:CRISPR-associated protein Cmr1
MVAVTLTVKAITPLFLGGANPREEPELRPASFRGALRFWLRAALGGVIGDDDDALKRLRCLEAGVFGDTERGSVVGVRLHGSLPQMRDFDLDRNRGIQNRIGHDYFYYSTRLRPNYRVPFTPSQPETQSTVALTLSTRLPAETGSAALKRAAAASWLLTHLGGLGMRARRCGGSLQAVGGGLPDLPNFPVTASTSKELQSEIGQGLQQVCAMLGTRQRPSRNFDVLDHEVCKVWVIGDESPWNSWKDAVEAMGAAMQTFRTGQGAGRNTINSIFGVPIRNGPNHGLQRRASPLWLRVTQLTSGQFVGVATLFTADFKKGTHEVGGGYALIEQFIKTFRTHEEVTF